MLAILKDINILLLEDSSFEARIISDKLQKVSPAKINITHVKTLKDGIKKLNENNYDVVLIDLILPDSQGFDTFISLKKNTLDVPCILLTGINDENIAVRAVQEGAQDYLVKGQVSGELLIRSIRYAIERHRVLAELKRRTLIDDLTGLYNRRGFFTLVEQEIKVADRYNRTFSLIYADLDGLKWINDNLGHQAGDSAIINIANILKSTFRDADIIARIGGDEFVILVIDANEDSIDIIRSRLQEKIDYYNKDVKSPYTLSLSVGIATYNPDLPCTIDTLINKADKMMYQEKGAKKKRKL